MCGRFTLHASPQELRECFALDETPGFAASYNIAPSQPVAAVRVTARQREMALLRWGLVPAWANEPGTGYRMINARAETVAEKPAYRSAFRHRRCLIPVSGFYEWQPSADGKQPWYFRRQDGQVFALAGLWEHWGRGEGSIESCAIIVTGANDTVRPVHDRMPVIIEPSAYDLWLDPQVSAADRLIDLLRPWAGAALTAYPVTRYVNSPLHNDARCIAPAGPRDTAMAPGPEAHS
jgi:putative SOS response-associated peptidase YedK